MVQDFGIFDVVKLTKSLLGSKVGEMHVKFNLRHVRILIKFLISALELTIFSFYMLICNNFCNKQNFKAQPKVKDVGKALGNS